MAGAAALTCGLSLGLVYCTPDERLAFDQPQLPTPAMSEDGAGIRIVEYVGAPDIQAPFGLSTDPRYRHGNSPGDYRFRHIYAGALLANGNAVVADAHNNQLIVLSPNGTMLGSKGERPVDFSALSGSIAVFALGQDSVLVVDRSRRGYVTLFVDGLIVRSVNTRFPNGLGFLGAIGSYGHLLVSNAGLSYFEEEWLPGQQFPVADAEGRVWLSTSGPGGPHVGSPSFAVISPDGEWLGTVEAPVGFHLLDVSEGLVLGVQTDETRRESVVVYDLIER